MDLTGVALLGERALRHAEDDLRAAVVEYEQIVRHGVDAQTLDLTGAAEVRHLAEQLETACLGTCGDQTRALHGVALLVEFHAERRVADYLGALLETRVGNLGDVGDVDVVGNVEGRFTVVGREEHLPSAMKIPWHQ